MDKINFFWIFISALVVLLVCFLTPGYARDVTLTWDTDPSVDGYLLYYNASSSGPPYNGTGAAEGDSPVDVGWVSEFTLRALSEDEDYYFTVTAYTQDGESGYSNEVTTAPGSAVATSSAVSGDGGSGGGCFISTIRSK
jgi:uncharacterized membrane protein YgcG